MSDSSLWVTCGTFSQARCRCGPDSFLMRGSGLVSIGPNLAKSTAGISGMPMPPEGAAVAGAALGPLRKLSTSSLVIRPLSPLPFSLVRSTPSSRATRRTPGLAWTWPKSAAPAVAPAPRSAEAAAWAGAGLGTATGWACGVGSCWLTSEGGWVMAPSPPLNIRIGVPSLTLSPALTRIFSTVPDDGAGTSMVALSDSSVRSGSSALIASPSLTRISMIGTSLKSPMSGTVTSVVPAALASVMAVIIVSFPVSSLRAQSNRHRIGFLAIDPVFQDRLGHHLGLDGAFLGQRLERRHRDPVPVQLEEVAQLPAVVRPAVAVGP